MVGVKPREQNGAGKRRRRPARATVQEQIR